MSIDSERTAVTRLQKEIGDLQQKHANEMKKVATASKNMSSALASAARASSLSSAKSYQSTADRESRSMTSAQERAAGYGTDIARKTSDLGRAQERLLREEERERKQQAAAYDKHRKADEAARRQLQDANNSLSRSLDSLRDQLTQAVEAQAARTKPFFLADQDGGLEPYDFFVSHASADKADFVDGLVACAEDAGLNVWYDQGEISWGDSIRQKIDEGLSRSYFGVVVLSPTFFDRPWTQYELDAIVQRDLTGAGRLLPIWHRLSQDDVARRAPSLAGRLALPTANYSTAQIVEELKKMRGRFKAAAQLEKPTSPGS